MKLLAFALALSFACSAPVNVSSARATSSPGSAAPASAPRTSSSADVWTPHKAERLDVVTAAAISPDGSRVAYTLSNPREAGVDEDGAPWVELRFYDKATQRERTFIGGKVNVSSVSWTPDGTGIAFLAKREGDKQTALYVIPFDGGEARKAAELKTSISSYSFAQDGKRVALVAPLSDSESSKKWSEKGFKQQVYEEDGEASQVWIASLYDLKSDPRRIEIAGSVQAAHWSPTADQLAVSVAPKPLVDDEYMRTRVKVVDVADGKVVASVENPGKLGAVGWSPDGKTLALLSAADLHDPSAGRLCVVPASGGTPRQVLPADEPGDAVAFAWQDASTLFFVEQRSCETSLEKIGVVDSGVGARKQILAPGSVVLTSLSVSKDGKHGAFVGSRPDHPPELYTMSHGDTQATRCTRSNPWSEALPLAKQEVVRWKARDGMELEGILIHPLDGAKKAPLIVVVHGGPEACESNGWLTNYSRQGQYAAAQGFAVFYPNYRGSTGRGVAFAKSSQGDAAGREFDDLVDAVDHLVKTGVADESKVGVTGGSYGGYATAWCSTRYSERFAAGVMFVGIADKFSKFGTTDIPDEEFYVHALKRVWDDPEFARQRSPITYADQQKTPLLILHGKDDPRVDPGQSRTMYRHLKLRGKAPVRLVLYPGEGHGNRKACARLDYALRSMQWFEHYLKGEGGEPPAYELDYADPAAPKKDAEPKDAAMSDAPKKETPKPAGEANR